MPTKIFVIQKADGEVLRIRAASYSRGNLGDGFWSLEFRADGDSKASAEVIVQIPYSVIPQGMLYDSLAESLLLPPVTPSSGEAEVEFLHDPLFTEEDKTPFSL